MSLRDYFKKLIRDYFVIFAIIVISVTVLRQVFAPSEYFQLKDIFIFMIAALIGDIPSLIFYSPKEISEKEMRIRIVIHFMVLEAVLLTFGNVLGLVEGISEIVAFALDIAVIYVLVRLLAWTDDRKAANIINKKLKSMKEETIDNPEEE